MAIHPMTEWDKRYKCNLKVPEYDGKSNIGFYISEFEDFVQTTNVPRMYWKVHLIGALKDGSKRGNKSCALTDFLKKTVMSNLTYEQLVDKLKLKFVPKLHNSARQRLQAAEQKANESLSDWHMRIFQLYSEATEARANREGDDATDELLQSARAQFIQRMYDPDLKMLCTSQMHTAPTDFDLLLEWATIVQDSITARRGALRSTPALMAHVVPADEGAAYAVRPGATTVRKDEESVNASLALAITSLVEVLKENKKETPSTENSEQPYRGGRGGKGRGGYKNSYRNGGRGRGSADRSFDSDSGRESVSGRSEEKRAQGTGANPKNKDKSAENA